MSNEDPYRPNTGRDYGRDRGAYTPPTDDDLPFDRQSYDPRRNGGGGNGGNGNRPGGGRSGPPITLIISAVVLLALIAAVVVYYRAGPRASNDAPPAVGAPVGPMTAEAPVDAQPVDPEAGIDVYNDTATPTTDPTYAPPPEEVGPRPAPQPIEPATPLPPATTRPAPAPAPAPSAPPPVKSTEPSAVPAGGSSGVQIGAFSTPSIAEREYNAVTGRYSRLTRGATRRVQEVTAANGSTVYRTTVTNLSREQATGLCAAIRDAGGDCLVR